MRKPADLVINIPGSTAPEVPYSQRTHAANEAAARLARVSGAASAHAAACLPAHHAACVPTE
jgi:hypothetical protein